MADKKLTLAGKLAAINGKIRGIKKDTRGNNYSYTSGDKIYGTIIPLLSKEYGITVTKSIVAGSMSLETRIKANSRGDEKEWHTFKAVMEYTFRDGDSDETITILWPVVGQQLDDPAKAMGTALTYSDRYFFLKQFNIETDKDDADVSTIDTEVTTTTKPKATARAATPAAKKQVVVKDKVNVVAAESEEVVKRLLNDIKVGYIKIKYTEEDLEALPEEKKATIKKAKQKIKVIRDKNKVQRLSQIKNVKDLEEINNILGRL